MPDIPRSTGDFLAVRVLRNPLIWGMIFVLLLVLALGGASTALVKWRAERALKQQLEDIVAEHKATAEATAVRYEEEVKIHKVRADRIQAERVRLQGEINVLRAERAAWKAPASLREAVTRFNAMEAAR